MSALPPKADIAERDWYVRFVPKADSCSAANFSLFDHFVSGCGIFTPIVAAVRVSIERTRAGTILTES
jgi:hypothetical protein